ncbi:hypothetical protein [Achromobacter sp. Bel]|uniref:hypothetical protein n=1 Tax=Achromobacter sp. Bel TaxID=2727415 RepID=UPI00145D9A2D|nr:hypothetical protein [Achromobacter sp. Bel]NMK47405.1 hypothetical protein [Achromobacter sp. Bel]
MYIKSIISCRQGWERLQHQLSDPGRFERAQGEMELGHDQGPPIEAIEGAIARFKLTTVRMPTDDPFKSLDHQGPNFAGTLRVDSGATALCRAGAPGEVIVEWSSKIALEDGQLAGKSRADGIAIPMELPAMMGQAWRELLPMWRDTSFGSRPKVETAQNVGLTMSGVALNLMLNRTGFDAWLFQRVPVAYRRGFIDLAVGVFVLARGGGYYLDNALRQVASGFRRAEASLLELQPISLEVPFVLLGLSPSPIDEPDFVELEAVATTVRANPVIERVIEVPHQYQQAVVGILGYFGTYLQQIAPEQAKSAKIRIEQGAGFLRLVVEAEDGARHIVERAFEDYQGIVRGDLTVDQLALSPIAAAELRSELRIANARIDFQKDMLAVQGVELRTLRELSLELSKRKQPDLHIQVSAQASATTTIDTSPLLGDIGNLVEALRSQGDAGEIVQELDSVGKAIEEAGRERTELSVPIRRLRGVLEKIQVGGTRLHGVLEKGAGAIEAAQKLARQYNSVADWCGLPQVPRAFTGRDV